MGGDEKNNPYMHDSCSVLLFVFFYLFWSMCVLLVCWSHHLSCIAVNTCDEMCDTSCDKACDKICDEIRDKFFDENCDKLCGEFCDESCD